MISSHELWDYDIERLNRHKTTLIRLCRELAEKLEEAKIRAVRAEQRLDMVRRDLPNYHAEVEKQTNHEIT